MAAGHGASALRTSQTPKLTLRSGMFYYREAIPARLRPQFGKSEWKVSLKTRDKEKAVVMWAHISTSTRFLVRLASMYKELTQAQLEEIARRIFESVLVKYNDVLYSLFVDEPDLAQTAAEEQGFKDRIAELDGLLQERQLPQTLHRELDAYLKSMKLPTRKTDFPPDSFNILLRYMVRAERAAAEVGLSKLLGHDFGDMTTDPLFKGLRNDTLPPLEDDADELLQSLFPKPSAPATHTPPAPKKLVLHAPPQRLGAVYEQYKNTALKSDITPKSQHEYERAMDLFFQHFKKETPVLSVGYAEMEEFITLLRRYPKHAGHRIKKVDINTLSLKEVVSKGAGLPSVDIGTVRKCYTPVRSFFGWMVKRGIIKTDPCAHIDLPKSKNKDAHPPFSDESLAVLFGSPLYTGSETVFRHRPGKYVIRDFLYWSWLVGVYTGMRLSEIAQLRFCDLHETSGIKFFSVNTRGERSVKTAAGSRSIPLHPKLLAWGLLAYINHQKKGRKESDFIFIDPSAKGRVADKYSKLFNRYLERINLKNDGLCFHSTRDTFRDCLLNNDVNRETIDALFGHSDNSAAAHYGHGVSLKNLAVAIAAMHYPFEKTFNPSPKDKVVSYDVQP